MINSGGPWPCAKSTLSGRSSAMVVLVVANPSQGINRL